MTISAGLIDHLLTLSPVTSLVGTRIRTLLLRQGEARSGAIRVQQVSETQPMHLRGAVNLFTARVQVDSYAPVESGVDAYANATAIDAAVHGDGAGSGLCGFAGQVGGSPGLLVDAVMPVGRTEEYDADELKIVRVMREYMVTWRG